MRAGKKRALTSLTGLILGVCLLTGCASGAEAANTTEQGADRIVIGDVELEIEQIEYRTQVQPPDPVGYYDYYPETEGYHYLVLSGRATNNGETDFDPECLHVEAQAGRTVREGKLEIVTAPGAEFWDVLPANETEVAWSYYLFAVMKDSEEADSISIFYNHDFSTPGEDEEWDEEIKINL
nr:hypothetical protein [uncultured Mediterraneibacter sp.]